MSHREPVSEEITKLYDIFARLAICEFNDSKECLPRLVAVVLGDEPGTAFDFWMVDPALVNAMQESEQTKDALMQGIEVMLRLDGPNRIGCVVHVSEVWVSSKARLPDVGLQAAMSEFQAQGVMPSKDPQRGEALLISIHTRERTYSGMCAIKGTEADRVAEFAPLLSGGEAGGRFMMQDRAGHVTQ